MQLLSLESGKYRLSCEEQQSGGIGIAVYKKSIPSDICLYQTKTPLFLMIKDYAAKMIPYDAPYAEVELKDGLVIAKGTITTILGSVFSFTDTYEPVGDDSAFTMSRKVTISNAQKNDLGFMTRYSLGLIQSQNTRDYQYFAPGAWYKQNEHVPPHAMGHDLDEDYSWYRETRYALPLFSMQNTNNGDTVTFCRAKADVTASEMFENHNDARTDASLNYGSLGMSKPGGLSIDYVYPGTEGNNEEWTHYYGGPYQYQFGFTYRYHPVEDDFVQKYSIVLRFTKQETFYSMMRETWRYFYNRFNPKIAPVSNEKLYQVCMDTFDELCQNYYGSWGVPFKCLLPSGEIGIVDYQFGFIGQQPNIGYQLLRYGYVANKPETAKKGENVLDFWVHNSLTEWGAPKTWYDVYPPKFLDQPIWLRKISDGMEGILDGYNFLKKQGVDKPDWLAYCETVGDWLVRTADEEGCWFRAYDYDGNAILESKANTSNVIRFLVQLYLTTGKVAYKETALKAGDWSYEHVYKKMEYLGGTCDNADVLDKESGIYAFFAFLSLYDLTGDQKWLDATIGAADYTATWTYAWTFPVKPIEKVHAYHHVDISGQSLIATGHSASDVYMAACSYIYFRLYVITGDKFYRDYAEFLHKNPKQVTDIDGSLGYGRLGICEESSDVSRFDSRGVYAWLPWCTYVQVDPISRMVDTFGTFEIEDTDSIPLEELRKKNRIYDEYPVKP